MELRPLAGYPETGPQVTTITTLHPLEQSLSCQSIGVSQAYPDPVVHLVKRDSLLPHTVQRCANYHGFYCMYECPGAAQLCVINFSAQLGNSLSFYYFGFSSLSVSITKP